MDEAGNTAGEELNEDQEAGNGEAVENYEENKQEQDTTQDGGGGDGVAQNNEGGDGDGNAEDIEKIKDEHYSQNKPDEFSSEYFKIEVGGLPKYYALGQLKKLFNITLQLDAHRVKPGAFGRNVAYVNFKNEEARFKALTILSGYQWQGATFTAQKADPAKDPMVLAKIEFLKVPKKEHEDLPLEDRIQKAVTPFHGMTYAEQLKEKESMARKVLKKFGTELGQINVELKRFVHWHKLRRKGLICEVDDIVESPIKEGYRNKCEFTIGKNNESDKPVVGFRVASYKEGSVEVGPIHSLRHINDKMKLTVKLFESFLESSKYEPYDPFSHKGVWRQLTIRTTQGEDVMLIVVIHPQEMPEDEINEIKESVKVFFSEGDGVEAGVTSIFFQQHAQKESGKDIEYEHIYGKTYIEETILGKTFKASPDSFLQVNTLGCEALYKKIAEVAEIDATTIVLDVCCGVGTIGLSIAECAYKIMGVEITPKAVEDARANAEANGIGNAVFYNGKAEEYIENMIERSQRVNTIAIVDPPRAGLSGSVMNALRKCEYLDKLIYVSCDPQAAFNNFQALGRPRSKTYKGTYFVPIRATPVDLFPDTPHYELIVVFERYDECKWDRIMNGNPRPKDQAYFDRIPQLTPEFEKELKDREVRRKEKERERSKMKRGLGGIRERDEVYSRDRDDYKIDYRRGRGRGRGGMRSWEEEEVDDEWSRRGRGFGRGGSGWERAGGRGWEQGGRGWERGGGRGWERGGRGWERGGRGWERGRQDDYDDMGRRERGWGGESYNTPTDFRQRFGDGFQEGFQAGLEALTSQLSSGFGRGGGWNKAQTTGGDFGPQEVEEDLEVSPIPIRKGNQDTGNWDYDGNNGNYNVETPSVPPMYNNPRPQPLLPPARQQPLLSPARQQPLLPQAPPQQQQPLRGFNTQQPVTYPTRVTNPQQGQSGSGFGFQTGGLNQNQSGNNWGPGGTNNQMSNWSGNQFQNYDDAPAPKRWKSGIDSGSVNYNNFPNY